MSHIVTDKSATTLVANIVFQVCGVLPKDVRHEDSLIHDLLMDSVELIDLLMRLEEIGVNLPESDITSSLTVGDIVQRVQHIA